LAREGFTGAPALTIEDEAVAEFWADLGVRWLITEQYFKPYGVCRWAQPTIAAALKLRKQHDLHLDSISSIHVATFHEAVCLASPHPATTEDAQYSLPFPVAAALVHQNLGPAELSGRQLRNPLVLKLSERVKLVEDPAFSDRFPTERFARVRISTDDGTVYDSGEVEAAWGEDNPPSDEELRKKFLWLAQTSLLPERAKELEMAIWGVANQENAADLCQLLAAPPQGELR